MRSSFAVIFALLCFAPPASAAEPGAPCPVPGNQLPGPGNECSVPSTASRDPGKE